MNRNKFIDVLFTISKWIIAVIFIYAGVIKVLHPASFAVDIDNYRILPYLWVTVSTVILPWFEIFCGVFLLYGRFQKGAALSLMILSIVFLIAITSAVARGLDISCGCFGIDSEASKVSILRMIEDLFLFALLFVIYKRQVQRELKNV